MIGREFNSNISFLSRAAEAIYHFDIAVQETQSTVLLVMGSSASSTSVALVTAAQLIKFPVINFYRDLENNDEHFLNMIMNLANLNLLIKENGEEIIIDENQLDKLQLEINNYFSIF
ncbi:unnamed protein product [Brachionus calyciflorus]|uniref:Uncharacterized protein n=1 Tax=Brachionus calyciflorus TaxID=104777 RepID=A0A814RAM8_9BILA|nr:unnamed protein product [Brachionus calyciflorus]